MQQLGTRIGIVLKLMNLSRGQLAVRLRVDKSLVGRWVSGQVRPSAHNLAALTALVAERVAGFNLLCWELDDAGFAAELGLRPTGPAEAGSADEPTLPFRIVESSRREVSWEGDAYPGFYLIWRLALNNSGMVVRGVIQIERRGDDLRFRETEGINEHRGHIILNRGQLYAIGEEEQRQDGMFFLILNGVGAGRALILDGIMLTVCSIRTRPPGATIVVLERLAEASADERENDRRWHELKAEALAVQQSGGGGRLASGDVLRVIAGRVGAPREDGEIDLVLRLPLSRSLARCESDAVAPRPTDQAVPAAKD